MADNVITPQESEVLAGNLDTINQLMAQIQGSTSSGGYTTATGAAPTSDPNLGIDRHRIMGIQSDRN